MHITLRRRRRSALLAMVAAMAVALAGCGSDGNPSPSGDPSGSAGNQDLAAINPLFADAVIADAADLPEGSTMAAIKARGKLVVAAALDAPLLSQQNPTNPDEVSGFDAYLAQLLAIYILGSPDIEIVPPATQTREALLQNGTVDVVFNTYTITEERAEQVSFAGPYLESGLAVAVRADESDINGIDDLAGKTVIAGENTPAVTAVEERVPTAELVTFATDPQALEALRQGRGDAYVQDFTLLAVAAAEDTSIKIVGETFSTEPFGIGLKHGDDEFKSFVNEWLRKIQENGTWAKVWEATLGSAVQTDAPKPPEIGSVPGS